MDVSLHGAEIFVFGLAKPFGQDTCACAHAIYIPDMNFILITKIHLLEQKK